jgi:hypothetical protein
MNYRHATLCLVRGTWLPYFDMGKNHQMKS